MAARIAKVLFDYDTFLQNDISAKVLEKMRTAENRYDLNVLSVLQDGIMMGPVESLIREVAIEDLEPWMILGQDILDKTGRLLVAKGNEITPLLMLRLQRIAATGVMGKTVHAYKGGSAVE